MTSRDKFYGEYPNLSNNELPLVIGCPDTENMEAVKNFFLRSLYKDVKIHEITYWKRNCQPACAYTVVYKIKDKTPDLNGKEISSPFPDKGEDLKKMFSHITKMVYGMDVVEKKYSNDRVYASVSYAPACCACNVQDFDMVAEEPRMRSIITEVSSYFCNMKL